MSYLSGSQGAIQFGNPTAVNTNFPGSGWRQTDVRVTNWTMNSSAQLLDTTTLGDYDKHSVYGLRTHTGTLRLLYYNTATSSSTPDNNAASWFINALTRASDEAQYSAFQQPSGAIEIECVPVELRLYLNELNQGTNADYIQFDANLTSVSYGSNVGELVAVDATFEASGRIFKSRV